MNKRTIGTQFESLAADYLENIGYEILEQNFRSRRGEIDIIAKDGDYLVFVEVKYRTNEDSGRPEEHVDRLKQHKITNAAKYYLCKNHLPEDTFCRFDVIGLNDGHIQHFQNAFDAC